METRSLGKTGLTVSLLSFGCVELGIPYGIGVKSQADMLPDDQAVALLQTALERGITFYDTAPSYGSSERLLGRAFADRRERVVLCTKCPALTAEDGTPLPAAALRERLLPSLEGSLKALQTDHVDILMLHSVSEAVIANDEVAELFADLKRQRLIRASGASTYPGGITERVLQSRRWDVVQLAFNLLDQRETAYLDAALDAGVGIVVRSVLFKGILTDRGRSLHPALKAVQDQRERCLAATPRGMALSAFATRYAMSKRGVSSVLVGIDRLEYLEQAVTVATAGPLTPAQLRQADALAFPDPGFLDLPGWHRKGWLT